MRGFLLPIPLRLKPSSLGLFFCWKMVAEMVAANGWEMVNGGRNGGKRCGGSGGNVGGYIGGKKHKPPFPLSRRSKRGLTFKPTQYCVSNGLNLKPIFSVFFWGWLV